MELDDILLEAEEKMLKTEEVVQHEFAGVRTGKASPAPGLAQQLEIIVTHLESMLSHYGVNVGSRMARKHMFFSSAKATRELGYTFRPPAEAFADAGRWFDHHRAQRFDHYPARRAHLLVGLGALGGRSQRADLDQPAGADPYRACRAHHHHLLHYLLLHLHLVNNNHHHRVVVVELDQYQ